MLTNDCIATCVQEIGDKKMLIHDMQKLYEDGITPHTNGNFLDHLHLRKYIGKDYISTTQIWAEANLFWFVCGGMFHKSLCDNLRFSPNMRNEDILFGMVLFAKTDSIKVIKSALYIYRIRANSTGDYAFSKSESLKSYPAYIADIANTFNNNLKIKQYYFSYSIAYICLGILAFIDTLPPSEKDMRDKLNIFISKYIDWAFGALKLESDLKPLEPYTKWVGSSKKLAYFAPHIFSILRASENIFKR